ncbi:hypothetical protein TYRP_016293 [Tyrophagus putrescentiae]|nr:hypothetical protein TYRP_016293 [Tyrophagus putrescentiae]
MKTVKRKRNGRNQPRRQLGCRLTADSAAVDRPKTKTRRRKVQTSEKSSFESLLLLTAALETPAVKLESMGAVVGAVGEEEESEIEKSVMEKKVGGGGGGVGGGDSDEGPPWRHPGRRLADHLLLGGVHVDGVDGAEAGQRQAGLARSMHRPVEAAEDVALEVRAEDAADAAEDNWIEAAVEEGQDEAEDAPDVPEGVVVLIRLRVKQLMLRLIGAHRILRGANQTARHQRVEDADHYQRNDVVGEKLGEHHHLGVPGAEVLRKGIAHLHLVAGLHLKLQHGVPPLVGEVANRVVGGGVPLDAEGGQREDGDADRQVAGELADLAHQQAVGPRLEGVDGADEGDADEDEGEVAGGQREDVHVGDGAHRLVLVEDVDDGAVADGAQHEDQQEDERDDVGLRTGLVGDVAATAAAAAAGVGAVHTTSGAEGTRATGSGGGGGRQWCVVQHVQRVAAGCGGGGAAAATFAAST